MTFTCMSNTQLHLLSTCLHVLITQYSINNINKICTKRASKAIHLYVKNSWSKCHSFNFRTAAHTTLHVLWTHFLDIKAGEKRCRTKLTTSIARLKDMCPFVWMPFTELEKEKEKERIIKIVQYRVHFLLSFNKRISLLLPEWTQKCDGIKSSQIS